MPRMSRIGLLGSTLLVAACCIAPLLAEVGLVATPTPEILQFPGVVQIAPPYNKLKTGGLVWSPDSTQLAVTHSEIVVPGGTISTSLYRLDIYSGEMRLVKEVDHALYVIAWLQDDRIAFNIPSYVSGEMQAGIWIIRSDGIGSREYIFESGVDTALWSPDEQRVAVYKFKRGTEMNTRSILIHDFESGVEHEVFRVEGSETSLTILDWSPDGENILLLLDTKFPSNYDIYSLEIATGEVTRLTQGGQHGDASWSPDGELIAYIEANIQTSLYIMRSDGSCPVHFITSDSRDFGGTKWSPDGRWIAFTWNEGIYLLDVIEVLGEGYSKYYARCP